MTSVPSPLNGLIPNKPVKDELELAIGKIDKIGTGKTPVPSGCGHAEVA